MSTVVKMESKTAPEASSLDDLLNSSPDFEVVKFGELWGRTIYLRTVSAGDIIEFNESMKDKKAARRGGLRMLLKSLCKSDGTLFVPAITAEAMAMLSKKPHKDTEALLKKVSEINDLGNKDKMGVDGVEA
jgi:hypothetical protein